MKLISDADRYASGETNLKPEAVLRLASRLDKAREKASRTDRGLYELARERILAHLLRRQLGEPPGTVARIAPAREGAHLVVVRPPKGRRAPLAVLPIDHLPDDVREAFADTLALPSHGDAAESVEGLDVRSLDPALTAVFQELSAADCVVAGRGAEEEYDYDRAVAAYRLAVLRSEGQLDMVRELVRFLSELYADYDEIADLLLSPRIGVTSHRDLHIHLAHALFHLQRSAEAIARYEALLTEDSGDAELQLRLGQLLLDGGAIDRAAPHLERAARLDPGSVDARRLLERCQNARRTIGDDLLAQAEEAFALGDRAEARRVCASMSDRGIFHAGAATLLRRIASSEAGEAAATHVARADQLAKGGDWRSAAEALREAERADPEGAGRWAALSETVRAALDREECDHHLGLGRDREAAGDRHGALLAYARAIHTGASTAEAGPPSALLRRLQSYLKRQPKPTDRQLEGLAWLHAATLSFEADRVDDAESQLRDAQRHIREDADALALQRRVDGALASRRREAAETLTASARALASADDVIGALAALDKAAALMGPDYAIEERRQLRAKAQTRSALAELEERIGKLAAAGRWWSVLHGVKQGAATSTALDTLIERASAAIGQQWRVERAATSGAGAGAIALSDHGFEPEYEKRLSVTLDGPGGRIILAADHRLVIAPLSTEEAVAYTLPAGLSLDRKTSRVFTLGDRIVILDCSTHTLTTLGDAGAGLEVQDRVTLDRTLQSAAPERLATETAFDPETARMLAIVGGGGRARSRLLSVDVADGHTHNEEAFSFPVFNLHRLDGTPFFTVQRQLNVATAGPRFYNFAVVDARTRIQNRVVFREIEEPMHAIRRIVRIESGATLCQYWFIDPFSGQVVKESNAFMELKDDWTVRYQNSQPAQLLGGSDERGIIGSFCVHEPSESVVFPWLRYDKEREHGLSVVSLERFESRWELDMPKGHSLAALHEDRVNHVIWVELSGPEGVVLRRLNWGERSLD